MNGHALRLLQLTGCATDPACRAPTVITDDDQPAIRRCAAHALAHLRHLAHATAVLQAHRRVRNVRSCSGCDWHPTRPGYASDPEATMRRHAQFNEHLAQLIVDGPQ